MTAGDGAPVAERRATYRLRCSSRIEFVDVIHGLSERIFALAGLADDEAHWPVLAVREAVMNAILHGNGERPEKTVEVRYTLDDEGIDVEVRDQGRGFDPASLPDPTAPENLLREAGRGIMMIRGFMDDLSFEFPDEGGTCVRLRKNLGPGADEASPEGREGGAEKAASGGSS